MGGDVDRQEDISIKLDEDEIRLDKTDFYRFVKLDRQVDETR